MHLVGGGGAVGAAGAPTQARASPSDGADDGHRDAGHTTTAPAPAIVTVSSATASAPRTSAAAPSSAPTTGHGSGGAGDGALGERGAQGLQEQLPRVRELAADHEELGVEQVAHARGGDAEVVPGVGDDPAAPRVARLGRAMTSREREVAVAGPQHVEQDRRPRRTSPGSRGCRSGRRDRGRRSSCGRSRRRRRRGRGTPRRRAPAHRRRRGRRGRRRRAACRGRHRGGPRRARRGWRRCRRTRAGRAGRRAAAAPRRRPTRAACRGRTSWPVRTSTGAGTPTPTASTSDRHGVDGVDHLGQQQRGALEALGRRGGRAAAACAARRRSGGRRRTAPRRSERVPKCMPGDEAEVAGEGHLLGAAAAARGGRRVQDAGGRQLLDDVGHGGRGQAGDAGQLDLRERATLLDGADDPRPVGFTQ